MGEGNQLKAGQLIPATSTSTSELDQMFNGLGLGSYVSQKASAEGIATTSNQARGLSLSEKQKLVRDSQISSAQIAKTKLTPMAMTSPNPAPMSSTQVDLTSTLMAKNVTQLTHSQTFSSPNSWNAPQSQKKPDLSAFDSLLPSSKSSSNKVPMNSLMGFNSNQTPMLQPQSNNSSQVVKSLTASDISDLLS